MRDVCVDPYLVKVFDLHKYNCWDLAREFWKELMGVELEVQALDETSASALTDRAMRVAGKLKELPSLRDPCMVLMQRSRLTPHVGVFYKGRVLHINKHGAEYLPLDHVSACYTKLNFYTTEAT